jgi:hypothetical protein
MKKLQVILTILIIALSSSLSYADTPSETDITVDTQTAEQNRNQ